MIAPNPTPGKFGIMAKLFRQVDILPKDQPLILLKQVEQKE